MGEDGEPARIGYEVFRARHFVVRIGWDGGLEVETTWTGHGSTVVKLDEYQSRDLADSLGLWRQLRPAPIGPRER